jgi:hypothetical protein
MGRTREGEATGQGHGEEYDMDQLVTRLQHLEMTLTAVDARRQQAEVALAQLQQEVRSRQTVPVQAQQQVVDTRVLGSPGKFGGDRNRFADWAFTVMSYTSSLNPALGDLMDRVKRSTTSVVNEVLEEEDAALSKQLHNILVLLAEEGSAPMDTLKAVGPGQGAEAWRLYHQQWVSKVAAQRVSDFQDLLAFEFKGEMLTAILHFERQVKDYEEQTGKKVDDDTLVGVLLKNTKDLQLRRHLLQKVDQLTTWSAAKQEVYKVARVSRMLGPAGDEALSSTSVPMDVSMVQKGRGKGVQCFNCGGNHYVRDCPIEAETEEADWQQGFQQNYKSFSGHCRFCGEHGHREAECEEWKQASAQATRRRRAQQKRKGRGKGKGVFEIGFDETEVEKTPEVHAIAEPWVFSVATIVSQGETTEEEPEKKTVEEDLTELEKAMQQLSMK